MSAARFAPLAPQFHGAVALYRENRWWSRVRIAGVEFDDWGVRAAVELVPTPGLRNDNGPGWGLSGMWDVFHYSPERWGMAYVGAMVLFDRALVEAVVGFAAGLPPGFSPDHYAEINRFMTAYLAARRAETGESTDWFR